MNFKIPKKVRTMYIPSQEGNYLIYQNYVVKY